VLRLGSAEAISGEPKGHERRTTRRNLPVPRQEIDTTWRETDIAQVRRILSHASPPRSTSRRTLFDDARHATEIRTHMASSQFARLLAPDDTDAGNVVVIARRPARRPAGATTRLRRVRTLDRDLTTPANTCAAPLSARKLPRLQGLRWSLSGLEPAAAG
jgi:hypothetical protein